MLAGVGLSVALDGFRAAQPGWSLLDVLALAGMAGVGALVVALPCLLVGRRGGGLALGGLAALHLGMVLRYDLLLNVPTRDPRVLLGVLAVVGGSLALGWLLGEWLRRWSVVGGLLVGMLVLFIGCGLGALPVGQASAAGPNIVLVTLDTVRRDRLPMYGNERVDAPALEALGRAGTIFEDAVAAAPQTGPSHLSLLTGRYPSRLGVVSNGTPVGARPEMLSHVFKEAGWHTAAFVSAYPVHSTFGFDQGFDRFDDAFGAVPGLHSLALVRWFDAIVSRNIPRERTGDLVNRSVRRWIETAPEPFFLWVHYYDPHGPYEAPEGWRGRYATWEPDVAGAPLDLPKYWPADHRAVTDSAWLEARYDEEVSWTDHLVGELVKAMGERDVVWAITADHGESLTEHAIVFDHGDDLYDPALRVPLILSGPGVPAGARFPCQVSTVHVAETLVQLAGLEAAHPRDGDGLAAVLGGGCTPRDAFASTISARRVDPPVDHAVRRSRVKRIRRGEKADLFFDLLADPGELAPLADPREVDLDRVLDEHLRSAVQHRSARGGVVEDLLEQLGYVSGEEAE